MIARDIIKKDNFSHADIENLLSVDSDDDVQLISDYAGSVLLNHCGNAVHLRGLVEASNVCRCDCNYCGIRKSNIKNDRYTLTNEEILECALLIRDLGYGSMVIQSGERGDKKYLDMIIKTVEDIKKLTKSEALPDGLGITLSIGEQSHETYKRLFEAGAHRYLLRIETSNPELFAKIHPAGQSFQSRIECLDSLRDIGYQVGTGVMIAMPDQTISDLANDILFYRDRDIDMIGMGPFIAHPDTPTGKRESDPDCKISWSKSDKVRLTLLMIACTRIVLKDVNIASTTALQTLDPLGREKGLKCGANVIMPQTTPPSKRRNYFLYPDKSNADENALEFRKKLEDRLTEIGRILHKDSWGDSLHAVNKLKNDNKGN